MHRASAPLSWLKKLHLLVGLLAIAIKVAIPVGYMVAPQALAAGLTPIVLCTSDGNVTAFMDEGGQIVTHGEEALANDHQGLPSDHEGSKCAFAGQGVPLAAPQAASMPVLFEDVVSVATIQQSFVASGLGLAAPPPPKTGPPIQV
ncbi:MAG: DUF2946 family protein [Hyphomonadaceae bacterium]|jgi:hypothetical protein